MRFCGEVGYGESQETAPGVWEFVIEEFTYRGDVIRNIKRDEAAEQTLHDNLVMNNSISVVADEYANAHVHDIVYVVWQGTRWKVSSVEIKPPRLILNLGEVYNGPPGSP